MTEAEEKQLQILKEIVDERANQDLEWGGPDNDELHLQSEWICFVVRQLGKASYAAHELADDADYRSRMVKVGALACAAIEAYDRARKGVA